MNNTLDSSSYEIIRDESSESFEHLSERSGKQVSKISSNELLQVASQGIKVYLRFKPENDCENKLQDETYSVVSQSTLLTKFPNIVKKSARHVKKPKNRDNSIVSKKIKFTQIFDAEVSQELIFEQSVKSDVANFISGQNFSVITYGTTSSGKTYTLFGTDSNPGIIPRCIDFIFTNIDITSEPKFKPINGNKVICCRENSETETRTKLKCNKVRKKEHTSCETQNSANFKCLGHDSGMIHSIWLSFGEIYNEAVYDLLSEDRAGKDTRLKLVPDKDGTFVKGLRIVHAASALEAHQILTAAISKLRVAASSFNQHSSRSHAVFTIKLLKYYDDCTAEDVKVYVLNFYDLAGSGRLENASENDQIFIESRYINKSLLALNRCFKIVAENHSTKQNSEVVGPFRESCLTRLMQKNLCDKENLTIFVNLNTTPAFHVETQNILSLVLSLRKVIHSNTKFSSKVNSSGANSISRETSNWDMFSERVKDAEEYSMNEELRRQNEILMKELTAHKSAMLERECEIRNEFADMYIQMIKDHDQNWRIQMEDLDKERENLLKISIRQVEDYYEEKINSITRKRKRVESGDCDNNDEYYTEFCKKNCTTTIKSLQDVIKQLRQDLEKAVIERNDCKFTLTLIKKELQVLKDARNTMSVLQNISHLDDSMDQQSKIPHLQSSVLENSKKLREVEDQIVDKSCKIKDLQKQLQEKDKKLNEFECNLTKCETLKLDLMQKLMVMEQVLIDNNINVDVSNFSSNFQTNEFQASTTNFEETKLSFLYTNIETVDSPKIIARISTDKLPLLSESENRWSILETSIDKSDQSLLSNGSKNDSGITSVSSKSDNEGKDRMVYVHIQDKVKQLKNDYTILKDMHQAYQSRTAELSNELETVKHLMSLMKESASVNEQKLLEYEEQLSLKEEEIQRLRKDKGNFQDKYCQTSAVSDCKFEEYISRLQELHESLKIHDGHDIRISKFFEECKEKSISLENVLSIAYTHLEKNTLLKHCSTRVPKIDELEKELSIKNNHIVELNNELFMVKKDLSALYDLNKKLNTLEDKVKSFNEQKEELDKLLSEKLRNEECLEINLDNLSITIKDRESEIETLRKELKMVGNENSMNKENVQRLGDEILKSVQKMAAIKEELLRSEEIRINLERTVEKEIGNLRPRLLLSDKSVAYVNSILEEIECKQLEMNRLKVKLEQQDQDMRLIRENRDIFVERYKSLIEKLRNDKEVQIPDDVYVLDYVIQNTNQLETVPSDHDEDSKTESQLHQSETSGESNTVVVKSSGSNASLTSSSTDSMITVSSTEMDNSQQKLRNLCWIQ